MCTRCLLLLKRAQRFIIYFSSSLPTLSLTIYLAHARSSPLSLEVGPYDRHLNGLGVQLATGAAAAALDR